MRNNSRAAALLAAAIMAVTAVSCSSKSNGTQTAEPADTTAAVAETTAETATEAETEDTTAPEEPEETEETTKKKDRKPVLMGAAVDEEETAAEETTVLTGDEATTNGKIIVTKDFDYIPGVRMGMTADEVTAILGDAELDYDLMGTKMLSYGETVLMFGSLQSFAEGISDAISDESLSEELEDAVESEVKAVEDAEEDAQTETTDSAETDDAASNSPIGLMMLQIEDNTLQGYNGLKIGSTKEEVLDSFCRDTEDNTPDDMKKDDTVLIYGRDAYDRLDQLEKEGEGENLEALSGDYRLAYETKTDGEDVIMYMDCTMSNDLFCIYTLMFSFDEDDTVKSVTIVRFDTDNASEIF